MEFDPAGANLISSFPFKLPVMEAEKEKAFKSAET